jgi:heme O synthase-like polyprenyltransferase
MEYFVENSGAVAAPALTGWLILTSQDKTFSILVICIIAWVLCFFFYLGALRFIDKDTNDLRAQMAERAKVM